MEDEPTTQRLETAIRFRCPKCGQEANTRINVPEPDWSAGERMSDLMSEDQTDVTCNLCNEYFPAYVQNSSSGCVVTLDDYPDVRVSAEYAFYSAPTEDWSNEEVPADPFNEFIDSYFHLGDILPEYGVGGRGILPHSGGLINRMTFTQQIAAFEAYLGDALINGVFADAAAMRRLLSGDQELKAMSIPIVLAFENPNIVNETVKRHLQGLIYHNLAKVAKLYEVAFQFDIWPDPETRQKLFKAIHFRHDCVHRNGRTKEGKPLEVFTSAYVKDILDTTYAMVRHIEAYLGRPRQP